jgi:hypothetical protein
MLTYLLMMGICFLFTFQVSADDKSKNKWIDVKIKSKPLNAKQFEAFLAIPKDAETLEALYAAVPGKGVYYSTDGGELWINIGLKDTTVYQFVGHDQQNGKAIYVCTNKGLLRLDRDSKRFESVSIPFQNSAVIAIVFDSGNTGLIYAATLAQIFRSLDFGTTWQVLNLRFARIDSPRIRALVILPDSSDLLLAGTSQGIYKIRIKGEVATWSDTPIAGSPPDVNFFIACEYAKRQTLIAATKNKGIFYSQDGKIWTPMNIGLNRPMSSILSLSVDQKSATQSCFAAFDDGKIKKFRLGGLRVGIFNIYSPSLSLWETRRITDRLFSQLTAPSILDLAKIDTSMDIGREDVRKHLAKDPRLKNYDKIVIGVAKPEPPVVELPEEQQKIKLEINVYNVRFDSLIVSSKYPVPPELYDFEKYYPNRIDQIAKKVKEKEFRIQEQSLLHQYFYNGWRKWVTGAGLVGIGVLGTLVLSPDETKTIVQYKINIPLPLPPPFPDKDN